MRNGEVTPPLERARDLTNYKFAAWIQEPEYPVGDLSREGWLETGEALCVGYEYKYDIIKEYEPK